LPDASALGTGNAWPNSYLGRLEALALVERLNAELLASSSATRTLESWCVEHRLAVPARVFATVSQTRQRRALALDRALLDIRSDEAVRYRHVALACGTHVLSEADNWYVPSRLTPAMNRMLETTRTPFGRAIAALKPSRQILSVEQLWSPLPVGWEMGAVHLQEARAGKLAIPPFLFRHRAIVFDGAHRPIALVVETYTREVLAFAHAE
jgi:chorismate-pyruvate lyase